MSVRAESAERAERPRARRAKRATGDEHSSDAGLDLLRAVGWLVLHDVALPEPSGVQIDHVVAGLSGVCVINKLRITGSVTLTEDSLICADLSLIDDVQEIAAAAAAVRDELDGAPVVPVLCFDRSEDITGFVAGVAVCSTSNILELINELPDALSSRQYLGVRRSLTDVLVQSGGRQAVADPEVVAPSKRRFQRGRRSKPASIVELPEPPSVVELVEAPEPAVLTEPQPVVELVELVETPEPAAETELPPVTKRRSLRLLGRGKARLSEQLPEPAAETETETEPEPVVELVETPEPAAETDLPEPAGAPGFEIVAARLEPTVVAEAEPAVVADDVPSFEAVAARLPQAKTVVVKRSRAVKPKRVRREPKQSVEVPSRYAVPAHRKPTNAQSDPLNTEPTKRQVRALVPAIVGAVVIAAVLAGAPHIPDVVTWAKSFFVAPASTALGQPIKITASLLHPDLTVTAGIPATVEAVGAVAGKGRHFVAVPLTSLNRGTATWTLSIAADLTIVDSLGVPHSPDATVKRLKGGRPLARHVGLAPGKALSGLVVFAIPNGRGISQVRLTLDTESANVWAAATSSG